MSYEITAHGKLEEMNDSNDDLSDATEIAYIIKTGADLTDEEKAEIRETLRRGCYCEHDCCGHYFGGVNSITKIWDGKYIALAVYERNI
jgi:hypothetical protein